MNTAFFCRRGLLLWSALCCLALSGCVAQTGIPGHGGGKRFAIEQELVSAATRMAIKQIDLSPIRGKKVNIYVNSMGDSGAGNLTGGRFSLISQLHGYYQQQPQVRETYIYPRYDSTSTTTAGTSTSTSTTSSLLNAPISKTSQNRGDGAQAQLGMRYEGLGAYHNSEEYKSDDLQFLTAIVQTYMFLQGVNVAPPSEAEVDVYITVDVYGTVYTRVDWFLANNEILKARTGMEIFAVDTASGKLLMQPQQAVAEAEYNEQYVLWSGPLSIRKSVKKGEPLLADFNDAKPGVKKRFAAEKEMVVPIPFQYELEKRRAEKEQKAKLEQAAGKVEEKPRKKFRPGWKRKR